MKKKATQKTTRTILYEISAFCLGLLLLSGATVHAEHESLTGLTGPPFTDPGKIQEMPSGWIEKSVKYDPAEADADLVVSLDGQLYHAWIPIIQKYAEENHLKIKTGEGTCGLSAGKLSRKSVDIGAFCCPPGETDRLPGLRFHTLGIAAIALLVHPDNPVNNVTIEQARQIFQGKIYRWSNLTTAEDSRKTKLLIQPVGRLHCKSRPGHWRLLLDNEDLFSPSLLEVGAIPDMISQVAINPGAIGFEVIWMARYYQEKGDVKFLKINGYSPNKSSNLISSNYPLYRVYSVTTWEGKNVSNPHSQKLVNYIVEQAEHLDTKFSFIPASRLRKAGWKFKGNELTGEPD